MTSAQERSAQRRLREIYNRKSRAQRIKMAENFGYGGTDESKLRVLRRITAQVVPQGRLVKVNQYFKPYVTEDDPNPWDGEYPDLALRGLFHIVSSVMFVAKFPPTDKDDDGIVTYSNHLNTRSDAAWRDTRARRMIELEAQGVPRRVIAVAPRAATEPAFSTEVEYLFAKYARDVMRSMKPPEDGGYNLDESGKIIAIGFSLRGNQELVEMFEEKGIELAIPPPEGGEYGIALMPSRKGVKQGEEVPQVWAYEYQRKLPKAKQDRIIKYVNRASGQYGIE
jgi:hypothetical protein